MVAMRTREKWNIEIFEFLWGGGEPLLASEIKILSQELQGPDNNNKAAKNSLTNRMAKTVLFSKFLLNVCHPLLYFLRWWKKLQ